jgi:hypothetical protein
MAQPAQSVAARILAMGMTVRIAAGASFATHVVDNLHAALTQLTVTRAMIVSLSWRT